MRPTLPLLVSLAVSGCWGSITDPASSGTAVARCDGKARPASRPRAVRLTHQQYDFAVRDLLALTDASPSTQFLADAEFAGFNNAATLTVSDRQARDYRRAAESLAAEATTAAQLAKVVPCNASGGEACARQFIEEFGRRVYRRPLDAAKVDEYLATFRAGGDKYVEGAAFDRGIRLVIETMLQSPNFLYRVERSKTKNDEGLIVLDGYEIASRLSFALWNTIPDDTLLAAAAAGELDSADGVETHARRMLDDAKATRPIDDFHFQWMSMGRYADLVKDTGAFPGYSAATGPAMQREAREFIRHVVLEEGGNFHALMTEPTTFVNRELAETYGLDGNFSDDTFTRVDLDPTQRGGILTQLGFLTANAYPEKGSPIHRGVFIQRRVLCAQLPDPPPNIDTTLPPATGDIHTQRDQVTHHTAATACQGCHSIINPPGFAFENFDGVGALRTTDNGFPVDTTGTLTVGEQQISFRDGVDLSAQLANNEDAQRCYLTQWFRYSFGRKETNADACTIDELAGEVLAGQSVRDMLIAMTTTKAFRFRAGED